jgi:phosphatidylglycerophosphatase C
LAHELLGRVGYGHVPLVASTLKPYLGGMARHEHCFGPNKIPMLSSRGFAPPWAFTYTDHQRDLPVLKLSRERFLVNPKPEAVRLIQRELACETTILTWR